jgi:hypothetical protein
MGAAGWIDWRTPASLEVRANIDYTTRFNAQIRTKSLRIFMGESPATAHQLPVKVKGAS